MITQAHLINLQELGKREQTQFFCNRIREAGYVLSTYVAPQFAGFDLTLHDTKDFKNMDCLKHLEQGLNSALKITTTTRIPTGGSVLYTQCEQLFKVDGYIANCISHNVQWITQHNAFTSFQMLITGFVQGVIGGGGVVLGVNLENTIEWDELSRGYEITDQDLFLMTVGEPANSGSYTGSGDTKDVRPIWYSRIDKRRPSGELMLMA